MGIRRRCAPESKWKQKGTRAMCKAQAVTLGSCAIESELERQAED